MTVLRSYSTGTDGSVPGIGGCPFDMDRLQKDFVDGNITPTKIINFGGALTTGINMDLTSTISGVDGNEILDVLACSGFYESSTLNLRVPNLQKPGAARASDVWVVIPDNQVVPRLVQKLHQGAVDRIVISSLAFLKTGDAKDQPQIVQTHEYSSCYIKFVDPLSYGLLSVFSFSFVKVKITQLDFNSYSNQGTHEQTGQYVYEFDYDAGSGAKA